MIAYPDPPIHRFSQTWQYNDFSQQSIYTIDRCKVYTRIVLLICMWKPLEQYLIGAKRNFELFVHDVANDNLVNHRSNPCSCLQLSLGSAENNTLFSSEPSDSRKYVCVRRLFKPQSQPESRRVLIIIKLNRNAT